MLIPRDGYMKRLWAYKDVGLIKVITGMRRCGKSTLLQLFKEKLISEGVDEKHVLTANFELMAYDSIRDYKSLYELLKSKMTEKGPYYILLDEIQQVPHWEKAINSLNAEGSADIYITGSNAWILSSELSTLLSGRYVELKMLPLSFKEYLLFGHLPRDWTREDKFNQYLKFGGLPSIAALPQDNATVNDFLLGIYNTVIVKDILQRHSIKNVPLMEKLVRYIISNTGNLISPAKISGFLNSSHEESSIKSATIASYLEMLSKAYIVYEAHRYDIKGKEMLKTLSKYYVTDTGIRNMLTGYADSDLGHVLETVIFFELLRRGYQVFIGKWGDKEVDFLAVRQDEKKYYQVAFSLADERVKERELAPLREIRDNYEKTILTMDRSYISDYEGIKLKNIIDFLLE